VSDATLNFLGGLLAFLAVLIPLVIGGWRRAKAKGAHRELLTALCMFVTVAGVITAWIIQQAGGNRWIALIVLALAFLSTLVGFLTEPGPPGRLDVAFLALYLPIIFTLGLIIALMPFLERIKRQSEERLVGIAPLYASPTPSPSPSPTRSPSRH